MSNQRSVLAASPSRLRPLLLAISLVASTWGCASASGPSSRERAAHDDLTIAAACPTSRTEVTAAQCQALPEGYGTSSIHPLEWGIAAAPGDRGGHLFFGRLLCPDGTNAEGVPVDHAPFEGTTNAVSSMQFRGTRTTPADIVDSFEVVCGEEVVTLYVNPYRCGSPCPPEGFDLLEAEVAARGLNAIALADKSSYEEARSEAEALVALSSDNEFTHAVLSMVLLRSAEIEAGLEATKVGLAKVPSSMHLRMLQVLFLLRLEREGEAEAPVNELVSYYERTAQPTKLKQALQHKALVERTLGRSADAAQTSNRLCKEFNDSAASDTL